MSKNHSAVREEIEPGELETLPATSLRVNTRDVMERVKFGGERILIETFGRPMVVLVSFEDYLLIRNYLPRRAAALPTPLHPPAATSNPDGGLL